METAIGTTEGQRTSVDSLAALFPGSAQDMPVAWHHLRVPGPPPTFALTDEERNHPDPAVRYRRRTVQNLCAGGEMLALVDKASPHALHDLMVSGLCRSPSPSPADVSPLIGLTLWRTAASFVRFVSQPDVQRIFGLENGRLHLALNCDANTDDRESCQADKQLHLHLLHWTRRELNPLERYERLGDIADPLLRRQALDPLAFLGARLLRESLADVPLGIAHAELLPSGDRDVVSGARPLGCLLRLPGWAVLDDPAFEALVRQIHRRIETAAGDLLHAFTGRRDRPPPWRRHALLPRPQIQRNIQRLAYSAVARGGLSLLAKRLHELTPALANRIKRGSAPLRTHHMALNQPCYSLNLSAPIQNLPGRPLDTASEVYLILQTKLFSGIGGSGLLSLGAIPSVRILRGEGTFSTNQWHHRARFQHAFARFNTDGLSNIPGVEPQPVRRFADASRGWMDVAAHREGY